MPNTSGSKRTPSPAGTILMDHVCDMKPPIFVFQNRNLRERDRHERRGELWLPSLFGDGSIYTTNGRDRRRALEPYSSFSSNEAGTLSLRSGYASMSRAMSARSF